MGRNLDYNPHEVFELKNPEKALLAKKQYQLKIYLCV